MTNPSQSPESSALPARQPAAAPMGIVLHVADIEAASRFCQSLGFVQTAAFPRADGELAVEWKISQTILQVSEGEVAAIIAAS